MTDALLTELSTLGVELAVVGDHLRVDAPPGALTDELIARLTDQKQRLIAILSQAAAADNETVDLHLDDLDRRVVEAIRAGETIKLTAPPEPDPEIPPGWTRPAWITRLRQLANSCAVVRPDLAVKHRAEADRLSQKTKPNQGGSTNDHK